jgi:hypothetical protein
VRLVWDLDHPEESTWSFPVGQSGHIGSTHYKDLRDDWFEGHPHKVFDPRYKWLRP